MLSGFVSGSFSLQLISSRVASVATLWNLVGSSMTILLSYVVPAACYLRIRRRKALGLRMAAAWVLLILGSVALVVCTEEAVRALWNASAPAAVQGAVPSPTRPVEGTSPATSSPPMPLPGGGATG
jgi:hypothetical protein